MSNRVLNMRVDAFRKCRKVRVILVLRGGRSP
jgi:hypothetical protein